MRTSSLLLTLCLASSTACAARGSSGGEPSVARTRLYSSPPSAVRDTSTPRVGATILAGTAVVAAAGAIGLTVASELQDGAIRDGGYPNGQAIGDAESRGQMYNDFAFISGAVAVAALGAAVALYLYGHHPESTPPADKAKPASFLRRGVLEF